MINTLLFTIFLSIAAQPQLKEHEHMGCPENSKCSKKTGVIRQQWIEIAKSRRKEKVKRLQSFARSFGAPLTVWGLDKAELNDQYVIWDSPCKKHNLEEEPRISLVDVFSKDLSSLKKNKDVIIPYGLLLNSKNKIEKLDLLRGDAPILLSNNSVFYVQEVEGIYYTLELHRNGKIQLLKTPRVTQYPSEVQCPKELTDKLTSMTEYKNLYQGQFCKKIWNVSTNSYQVMALGWSCN